jgi:hypothetical protein
MRAADFLLVFVGAAIALALYSILRALRAMGVMQ